MLNVGVIGAGAFGNKIAQLAEAHEFPVWYINTSEEDTKGIFDSKNTGKGTIIGTEGGCGQERSVAIELIKENYKEVINQFPESLLSCDIIFVAGSAGGGTGSGFTPILVDVLRSAIDGIQFGVITTLPSHNEGIRAKKNSIDLMESVHKLGVPYMVYDNSKVSGGIPVVFEKVNSLIIDDLRIIRGDLLAPSHISNIDKKDLFKIVSQPGLMQIAKVDNITGRDFDHSSLSDMLMTAMKNSMMVDFERNGKIHSMGVVMTLEPNVAQQADSNLAALFDYVGHPIETYYHTQHAKDTSSTHLIAIMNGMGYPSTRLKDYVLLVESVKAKIDTAQSTKDTSLAGSLDWIDESKTRVSKGIKKKDVDSSIFTKY